MQRIIVGESVAAVMRGEIDVSQWDAEELRRGRKRASDGTFRGRPTRMIPREVYDELRRRTAHEFYEMVRQELIPAMEVVVAMARGDEPADATRLKACEQIIERFVGKAPERVTVTATRQPYEDLFDGLSRDLHPDEPIEVGAGVADDWDADLIDDE